MKKNPGTRVACDIATVLRRHQFVAREAAIELWRQGVSGLDIALASSLSDPQRLDLIDAVDELVKRRNLSNRKEKIMSPENFGTPFNPVSTVIEQDEENDRQRETADENLDADLAQLNTDNPVDDEDLEDALVDMVGNVIDKQIASEEDTKEDATNDEDTARLHVALKDPHIPQDGYVAEPVAEVDQTPEERQADLDRCCGTNPTLDQDREEGAGSDLNLYKLEAFGTINEKKNQLQPDDHELVDPDRERLTDVDHILNEKEKKEDPAGGTAAEVEHLIAHDQARSCCHRPGIRESVYKLIDGERDFQISKFGRTITGINWTPSDWLTLIDRYMTDALDTINDPDAQMVELRKVAALAVAAMEDILTPARV